MTKDRFYADLNPRYGARGEGRWVVFDRKRFGYPPTAFSRREAAERFADRMNAVEVKEAAEQTEKDKTPTGRPW